MKIPITSNNNNFLYGLVKMVFYNLLIVLNILLYSKVTSNHLGGVLPEIVFFAILILIVLSFTVKYRWKYLNDDDEILVTLQSNLLSYNVVKVLLNGELVCKSKQKGKSDIIVNLKRLKHFTKLTFSKNKESQVFCRFE
ncbi:hypothetical protein CXF95_20825 [Paraglaciecola sp. MB-3u-78]|jgi:hypothetical protein|nr:hypothetical protein CXF95_20825 [Paraglaciecola sp. MB-3u-78]